MRSAVARMGGDPQRINPLVPADLIIDHSVQVDSFGSTLSFATNVKREYERNGERYGLLRWAQSAFQNFRVVPPGMGIVHQVNLEYLASVVHLRQEEGETLGYLRLTARAEQTVGLVERYAKEQGIFRTDETPEPRFTEVLELDLASVEPSLAGPKRPQDRVPLGSIDEEFRKTFPAQFLAPDSPSAAEGKERMDSEGGTVNEAQAPSEPLVGVEPPGKTV